jgi:VanZ family protein
MAVVIWAGILFTFSTDRFSSEHTQPVVIGILHTLLPFASPSTLVALHDFVRKCAHFVNYFIFGLLLFRAIRMPHRGWHWRWAFLALLIAALYASSDEIHQIFVPSRGASIWDALLDTAAAGAAQAAIWAAMKQDTRHAPEAGARSSG